MAYSCMQGTSPKVEYGRNAIGPPASGQSPFPFVHPELSSPFSPRCFGVPLSAFSCSSSPPSVSSSPFLGSPCTTPTTRSPPSRAGSAFCFGSGPSLASGALLKLSPAISRMRLLARKTDVHMVHLRISVFFSPLCIVCGPNADQDFPLFHGTAPHAAPPAPPSHGGGALLRGPSPPPNGRFRIEIRAAREDDSLLAPCPKKREKKSSFLHLFLMRARPRPPVRCPPPPRRGTNMLAPSLGTKNPWLVAGGAPR